MSELKRERLEVGDQRAILVGVFTPADGVRPDADGSREYILDELAGLIEAAGASVVGRVVQILNKPHGATRLGTGKVQEVKELIAATGANLIAFDSDLTPAQGRNVEKELDCVVVDRSEVILDIFASRAQTFEAKLQVELAQLLYMRPRLTRMWSHLERIASGAVGSARGPGEKQLELDRRLVDTRIAELKRRLAQVRKRREREVTQRRDHRTVSLVGYTNAGKSTLMRALTGAGVYVADQLFATLDTRTRTWRVPGYGEVLLSDTVGFVRKLPHHLIESFKSTLEEARHADLLLHVVDAGSPEAESHIETVQSVLRELEIEASTPLLVLNKADTASRERLDGLRAQHADSLSVSAVEQSGLDRLADAVAAHLGGGMRRVTLRVSAGDGKAISYIQSHAEVIESDYHVTEEGGDGEDGGAEVIFTVDITDQHLGVACGRLGAVEVEVDSAAEERRIRA